MGDRGDRTTYRFRVEEVETLMVSAEYEVDATSIDCALKLAWNGLYKNREVLLETSLGRRIEDVLDPDNPFDAFDIELDPSGFCVYMLWGDDQSRPLYVGLSTNILGRLGSHMNCRDKRAQTRKVQIIRCGDEATMRQLEHDLIAKYQPPLNVVGITDYDELIKRYGDPVPLELDR